MRHLAAPLSFLFFVAVHPNPLMNPKPPSPFLSQFTNPLMLLLLVAGVLCYMAYALQVGGWGGWLVARTGCGLVGQLAI